jgi:hypothetical protein
MGLEDPSTVRSIVDSFEILIKDVLGEIRIADLRSCTRPKSLRWQKEPKNRLVKNGVE